MGTVSVDLRALPHQPDGARVGADRSARAGVRRTPRVHPRPRVPDDRHVGGHRDRAQHARRADRPADPAHAARSRPQTLDAQPRTPRSGLRGLLGAFGSRDSLGYFALRGDKTAIFSPTGKAAVVYRVVGGVTLAAGDPLGRPRGVAGRDLSLAGRGRPVRLDAGRARRQRGRRRSPTSAPGLDSLELGDEAVAAPRRVQPRGPLDARRPAGRQPGRRAGYTLDVRPAARPVAGELDEVRAAAEALARRGGRARLLDGTRPARRPARPRARGRPLPGRRRPTSSPC